ncbi:MAG: ATP-binding cassette domain-containing protein [Myxococcota bacterium]
MLESVSFDLDSPGMYVLMGPCAAGKSTLVRTLCGITAVQPLVQIWGDVTSEARCALVQQKVRFLTTSLREGLSARLPGYRDDGILEAKLLELGFDSLVPHLDQDVVDLPRATQRVVAIVRELLTDPDFLFVDEITAQLDEGESAQVIALLRNESRRRAVLCVTHNQQHARGLGGRLLLLAGGQIRADQRTAGFFQAPMNSLAADFVRTGSLALPTPGADPKTLAPEFRSFATKSSHPAASDARVPSGFCWLVPQRLAGCARPGLMAEPEQEIAGLQTLGIQCLFGLEETITVSLPLLAQHGIAHQHCPIVDMGVPTPDAAYESIRALWTAYDRGLKIAVHCRAGLGRTGTFLACALIARGASANAALDEVRRANPRWIQSDRQLDFLEEFSHWCEHSVFAPAL